MRYIRKLYAYGLIGCFYDWFMGYFKKKVYGIN